MKKPFKENDEKSDKDLQFNFNIQEKRKKINLYLGIIKFLIEIFRSLNPDSYRKLNEKKLLEVIKFFSAIILITTVFIFTINLSRINSIPKEISSNLNEFSTINFNPNISANRSFYIVKNAVYFDNTDSIINITTNSPKENATNQTKIKAWIILTRKGFSIKKPCISILPLECKFKKKKEIKKDYNEFLNFKKNKDLEKLTKIIIYLLAPYLFIILFVLLWIKLFTVAILISAISWLILIFMKRKPSFDFLLKMSLVSITIFTISYTTFSEITKLVCFGLYTILFIFGLLINYLNVDL